jgi:hypothetical protein
LVYNLWEIKIILTDRFERIMTRSEWICNGCGEGFDTKGKRDGHREREHRQNISIGIEREGIKRSENGKFVCNCGRDYVAAQSLQRHQKHCREAIVSEEITDISESMAEGIFQFPRCLVNKMMLCDYYSIID